MIQKVWFELGNAALLGLHTGARAAGISLWPSVPDLDDAYAALSKAGFNFESPP